jgi:hypothetical protein
MLDFLYRTHWKEMDHFLSVFLFHRRPHLPVQEEARGLHSVFLGGSLKGPAQAHVTQVYAKKRREFTTWLYTHFPLDNNRHERVGTPMSAVLPLIGRKVRISHSKLRTSWPNKPFA